MAGTALSVGAAEVVFRPATSSAWANCKVAAVIVVVAGAAIRYTRRSAGASIAVAATAENVAKALGANRSTAAAINAVAATAVVIAGGAEVAIRAARTAGGVAF